ncbi:hypothetical protein [Rosenbergiella epipactidis]|uniref:hypothetical protein n=1 Tax=Rosenbergiella epipactidis TaxID=1544694 RepID=UPI001F4E1800|nr:hypothetical protein [Rosenbergiella epipactidis]
MKKRTKQVTAFGLTFDVHRDVKFITVDSDGMVQAHYVDPVRRQSCWLSQTKGLYEQSDWLFKVDFEGENWQECIAAV